MWKFLTLFITAFVISSLGCSSPSANNSSNRIPTPSPVAIDRDRARVLSDSIVQDLLSDDRDALLSKMEADAREYFKIQGLSEVVDKMFDAFGKPLSADYKKDELGRKTGTGGYDKPMRKFWYLVETTKHPKSNYFIFVEVVPDGTTIASSGFSIVNFPVGVPPDMQ